MSNQIDVVRGVVRRGASLLRSGADLLDRAAGRQREDRDAEEHERFSRADPQAIPQPKDLDDVTLTRKVESIVFRVPGIPKGSINVNSVDGVVYLRGQVEHPEDVKRAVEETEAIPEVVRVENLLHLPGTPAPTRTDTPVRQRKPAGRRTKPKSPEVHVVETGITDEQPVPGAEPSPEELAREHRGRPPSPLGSREEEPPPTP
jgi:HSP20 family molecular chaperone IbpA